MTKKQFHKLLFSILKYTLFLLLMVNVYYFWQESLQSSEVIYKGGLRVSEIIIAFAEPIDSLAWILLLFLFELETAIIDDEALEGPLSSIFSVLAVICYITIVYSWWGYLGVTSLPRAFGDYAGPLPCSLIGQSYSYLVSLGEYVPLSKDNCGTLIGSAHYNPDLKMFATSRNLFEATVLAWTDVANASIWLIIVAVLQLEIQLESSRLFGLKFFKAYKVGKFLLYLALFIVALVWAAIGDPLDAWDAVLWLLAFFFIEVNIFTWQEEVARKRRRGIYSEARPGPTSDGVHKVQ